MKQSCTLQPAVIDLNDDDDKVTAKIDQYLLDRHKFAGCNDEDCGGYECHDEFEDVSEYEQLYDVTYFCGSRE